MEASISLHDRRAEQRARVRDAFSSLGERYLGAEPGFDATFEIRLGDVGRTWQVRARPRAATSTSRRCASRTSSSAPTPPPGSRCARAGSRDSTHSPRAASTPAATSTSRCASRACSGFPSGRPPLVRLADVELPAATVSTLVSGDGPEQVVCLHGLGSNKTSFFETISALSPEATVHALDLPGFGSSSKPARGGYDAPWFAACVRDYLDARGSSAPTSSATRWAGGSRSSWRSRSPTGSPR